MTSRLLAAALFVPALLVAPAAFAQVTGPTQEGIAGVQQAVAPEGFALSIGPGVLVGPDYPGSSSYKITPIPGFSLTYDDWFFIDPARGLGVQQEVAPGLLLSGGVDYFFGRDEDDSARLTGLGDLGDGVSAFGFASFRPARSGIWRALSLDTRIEAPFTGDIGGAEITADLVATIPAGGGFISLSGGAAFMTGAMMDDFFGVTPVQSAASIFPAYDPDGGLRAWRLGITALRPLGGSWLAFATGGYDRLSGDAAKSPIVEDRDQFRLVATIMYRFGD